MLIVQVRTDIVVVMVLSLWLLSVHKTTSEKLLISPISYILLASLSFFLHTSFGFIFPVIVFYIYKFDLHLLCYQVYAVDASNIAVQVLCWINFQLLLAEYGA